MANNKNKKSKSDEVIDAYINNDSLKINPDGSWTGRPLDKYDRPVQDADDL